MKVCNVAKYQGYRAPIPPPIYPRSPYNRKLDYRAQNGLPGTILPPFNDPKDIKGHTRQIRLPSTLLNIFTSQIFINSLQIYFFKLYLNILITHPFIYPPHLPFIIPTTSTFVSRPHYTHHTKLDSKKYYTLSHYSYITIPPYVTTR